MTELLVRFSSIVILTTCSTFANSQSRGELLYTTHCVSCHTTQVHWRADKQAYDWGSLRFQVSRWQGNAGLQWREADITEVSRYLNEIIYRFPPPADRVGRIEPPKLQAVQLK